MEQEDGREPQSGKVPDGPTLMERMQASVAALERLTQVAAPDMSESVRESLQRETAALRRMRGELEALLSQRAVEREQRQARLNEEQAREHRTLSLNLLAAGLAHEINNPLAYTTGNIEYLQQQLPCHALPAHLADECHQVLDEALEGARHIRRVVADLRALSQGDSSTEEPVDLPAVLERTLRMAANHLRHRARVVRSYGANVPRVVGTTTKLGQVALNLVINAAQALPEGRVSENQLTLALREEPGVVVLSISDTGRGIPPDVLPHVFDPFFTTRGGGMGMGLPICRDIIISLGGSIRVDSEPGKGTTVEVTLRRADLPEQPQAAERAAPPPQRARRILVVDDEPRVVDLLRRLMRGHELVSAANGREALERIRATPDFDVILCDLMMPELTGMDVYEAVRATWPGLHERIVFISGGVFSGEMQRFLKEVKNPLLTKPFEPQRLQGVLATARGRLGH
ncbi:ATP-binding protein [Corallococcus macrosporus]|uniref:histidine kinase n=1 Tax=Myxococcus fulvus (strain ATCC BAA-855 / HW-1) TaxID=483219 RepID=F8CFW1_MYXFH|nr:ATP-binding protein [Corallococcus macrosporus]AEI66130.1 GAF sensor hybrid histidine kinase [Corallococcus macrosporus]